MTSSWPDPPRCATAEAALHRMRTTIAVAQGLAQSGRAVDLTGLDAAAGVLCAHVLDLAPSEGATLRDDLVDLGARLEQLASAVRCAKP